MSHVKFSRLKLRLQEKRHTTLTLAGAAHANALLRRDTAPVGSAEAQLWLEHSDATDADSDALPPLPPGVAVGRKRDNSGAGNGGAGAGGEQQQNSGAPSSLSLSRGFTQPTGHGLLHQRSSVSGLVFAQQEQSAAAAAAAPRFARSASSRSPALNATVAMPMRPASPRIEAATPAQRAPRSPALAASSDAAATVAATAAVPAARANPDTANDSAPLNGDTNNAHFRYAPAATGSAAPSAAPAVQLDIDNPSGRSSPLHAPLNAYAMAHEAEEEQPYRRSTLFAHQMAPARSCCPCIPDRDAPFWNTQFRLVWDVLLAFITVYHFITIPLRIGMYESGSNPDRLEAWAYVDYPLDAMLLVDIVLRCVVFLPLDEEFFGGDEDADAALAALEDDEEEGDEAMDAEADADTDAAAASDRRSGQRKAASWSSRNRIFLLYLRSYFTWDLLGSIPLDMVAIRLGVSAIPFLRLNKLLRLKRFATFWNNFPDSVEHVVRIGPNVWRIWSYACMHLLMAHWSACGWCFLGQLSLDCPAGLASCVSTEPNWLQFDHLESASFSTKYARAIYGCASTLFTVGLGDIRPLTTLETVYFACVATLGGIMCARLSAAGASIFSQMQSSRFAHDKKMQDLKAYMASKWLPPDLQARVLYYHEYLWQAAGGMDEKKVLDSLPAHLRMEALVFLEGDAIRKVPFLAAASAGLINSIALVLQPALFSPDTYITVKGQFGEHLFLVHKGECGRIEELDAPGLDAISVGNAKGAGAMHGGDGGGGSGSSATKILSVLHAGSYFAELDIFPESVTLPAAHASSIKSFTFLELFKLSRSDFVKVVLLCCHNNAAEAEVEMRAMHRHQLAHSKSHSKAMKLLGGLDGAAYGAESPLERQIRHKWYYGLMQPSSLFRTGWLLLSNLIVLFWLGWLPFRIAFMYTPYNLTLNDAGEANTVADHSSPQFGGTPSALFLWWLLLDIACDVFFIVDMALKCRYFFFHRSFKEEEKEKRRHQQWRDQNLHGDGDDTAFSSSSRLLHTRPDQIYQRYRRSHLLIDCIASLPIDYLIGATLGWQWAPIPRLLRLLRLHILRSSFLQFRRWILADGKWQMNPDLFTLVAFFHGYLIMMHLVACIWYGSGMLAMRHDTNSWLLNERDPSTGLLDPPTTDSAFDTTALLRNYVRALYFACTTTTTTAGYRDVLAYGAWESVVCAAMIVSLALMYYLSMGCIAVLISQISADEHQHQERMDTLLTFVQQHMSPTALADQRAGKKLRRQYLDGLSPRLAQSIKSYYTYLWFRQRGVKEETILSELPTALREEVAVALNLSVLQSLTLFNGCSSALLQCILNRFRSHIYLPNEYICRAHDVATEMLILNRGKAVVLSANETVTLEMLNRGTAYGEALFLMQLRRKASVKTLNFCDVSLLSTTDFHASISLFPAERQRIFENSVAVRKRQVRNDKSMAVNRKMAKVKQLMSQTFTAAKPRYHTWSPTSRFVRNWQLLLIALSVYHCVMIPLRIAFVTVTPIEVFYLEYGFDLVFWVDIYFQLYRFSFVQHNGHLCTDPQLIAAHYRADGFWFDVLASTPLDFVALGMSRGRGDWLEVMAYLRLPRALRTVRIPAYFRRLRTFVQEAELGLEVNYLRLIELGVAIALISHWLGLFLFWMARVQYGVGEHPPTYTWLYAYGIHGASFTKQYLASLYWALGSITAVCFGDVTPHSVWEHVYVAISAIFCLFLVATMIGDVAGLLTRLDASATALSHKLNRFDEYARRHGLPDRLQRRVHQYWAHRHNQQRGVDEEELLADMPSALRTDVAAARYLRFLRPLSYFSFCEPNLLRRLCEALKVEIFIPGDVVLLEEDLGRQLLIVKETGFVAVVKRGVRGPNQAKYVRKLAQRGGQIGGARVPGDQAGRASPVLRRRSSHRRLATTTGGKRLEPLLPIGQIAQQLHQSKNGDVPSPGYRSQLASPGRAKLGLHRRTGTGGGSSGGGRSNPTTPVKQRSRNASSYTPAVELSKVSLNDRAKNPRSPSTNNQRSPHAARLAMSPRLPRPSLDADGSDESDDDDELNSPVTPAEGASPAGHSSSSNFSLRDILGTSMLYDVSYAQDGIVLSGVVDVAGSVSPPASPQQQSSRPDANGSSGAGSGAGSVAHSVEDSPIILQLAEGSMLGELSFFLPLRRTASVYATTFCTFLVLDRKHFNETMESLPHYVAKMRSLARRSVQEQAMKHASVRRNFTQHTQKLRKLCMVAATAEEKAKWGPEFQQRTASRASQLQHRTWLPDSLFAQCWKLLVLLMLLYHLIAVPFRICFFPAFPDLDPSWLVADYALDALALLDLYLNLYHFGFIDDALGVARTSPEEIAAHYKQTTHFKIDVLALLPVDILALGWLSSRYTPRERLFVRLLFRVGKLLRVAQLLSLVRSLAPLEKKVLRFVSRVGIGLDEGGVRFGKMLVVFMLASHWFGSLWFVVGYESTVQGAADWSRNYLFELANPRPQPAHSPHIWAQYLSWLHMDSLIDGDALQLRGDIEWVASGTHIYVRSVYYAAKSLCTLGMADLTVTNPNETGFTLLLIAASAMMLSLFVSVFEKTLRDADDQGAAFHTQMEYNRAFMKSKRLPSGLQDRINLYYSYMWNRSKGVDENQALATLSANLRKDVMMHKNKEIIELVPLFRECEAGFVKSIALVLQAAVFMPDDIIIRAGTASAGMYFVKDGVVAMERQGAVLMELGEGDFFGESHLLSAQRPATANYIALTFCGVYTLSKAHYEQVIEYYPRYRQTLVWKMSALNAQKRKEMKGASAAENATGAAAAASSPTGTFAAPLSDSPDCNGTVAAPSAAKHSPDDQNRHCRDSFQRHRSEVERKRATEAATVSEATAAPGPHASAATQPPTHPASTSAPDEDVPLVVRIHPGRLDPRKYMPQARRAIEVDVLVPSFRLSTAQGRALPSPRAYRDSIGQLSEFTEHAPAPAPAGDESPVGSLPDESPSDGDFHEPAPRVGFMTPPPSVSGFQPPPPLSMAAHRAIVFTPMPRSIPPTPQIGTGGATPTPVSTAPPSARQTPLSFHTQLSSPQPSPRSVNGGGMSIPLLRASGSNTPQPLSTGESSTLTFHLPTVSSPRRPNGSPPPLSASISHPSTVSSSKAPTQQWPPPDLDIDDSMREQLARMPYIGNEVTNAAQGEPSPPSGQLPPLPPDVTPLSPMLATWMRASHVLPERVRFPSDQHMAAAATAARTPRNQHSVLDIVPDEDAAESKTATPKRTRPVIRAFPGRKPAGADRPAPLDTSSPHSHTIDISGVDVDVGDSSAAELDGPLPPPQIAVNGISRSTSMPSLADMQRLKQAAAAAMGAPVADAALGVDVASSPATPASPDGPRFPPTLTLPPPSRRSKSHDLSSGADLDMQRLLSTTASRVAQHLQQPLLSPSMRAHAGAINITVSADPGRGHAAADSGASAADSHHHLAVHPSHSARRHSFNAAMLMQSAVESRHQPEPTFKSVFDF